MSERLDLITVKIVPKGGLDPCNKCKEDPKDCGQQLHDGVVGAICEKFQQPIKIINGAMLGSTEINNSCYGQLSAN